MFTGCRHRSKIGAKPGLGGVLPGAKVTAEVVGPVQGDKLYVFKFKRRKNYRVKTGHRQKYTEVMITDLKV